MMERTFHLAPTAAHSRHGGAYVMEILFNFWLVQALSLVNLHTHSQA